MSRESCRLGRARGPGRAPGALGGDDRAEGPGRPEQPPVQGGAPGGAAGGWVPGTGRAGGPGGVPISHRASASTCVRGRQPRPAGSHLEGRGGQASGLSPAAPGQPGQGGRGLTSKSSRQPDSGQLSAREQGSPRPKAAVPAGRRVTGEAPRDYTAPEDLAASRTSPGAFPEQQSGNTLKVKSTGTRGGKTP